MSQDRINELFATIDRLFDENKPLEAEAFMLEALAQAERDNRPSEALTLLNELLGYYRQTSQKQELLDIIARTMDLSGKMELQGTIPYATSMVNIANCYRSIGELDKAMECYNISEQIYDCKIKSGEIPAKDLVLAGFYNNKSLLYQELSDYKSAEKYQLMALEIVTGLNAGFEIAVSHANLANTMLLAGDYDKSMAYAYKAIDLFEQRNLKDPHYCAALSALGNCYLCKNKPAKAAEIFGEAIKIVEETFGRNSQYDRLCESLAKCEQVLMKSKEDKPMNGMEAARKLYDEYVKAMISDKFGEYESKIAVGLVGEGSECFGYDDDISTDHDFATELCFWINGEVYDAIGKQLQSEYDKLILSVNGDKTNATAMGQGRRGVFVISDFYRKFLGVDEYEKIDYASCPDYALSAVVNGEVFRDDEGVFSAFRNKLKTGYPQKERKLKLATDVANFSQKGQYNYFRMRKRGDMVTANILLHEFCKETLVLWHHMNNVYPPHDKWIVRSAKELEDGDYVLSLIKNILNRSYEGADEAEMMGLIDNLASLVSESLYEIGDISDTDNYLDHHIGELLFKAEASSYSDKELVRKIARLEFEAFDKVQNEGGRASCQNDWATFSVMRKSQYLTWNRTMLLQYYYDFTREYELGHNLITEKYGRMMESTAPEKYEEIKNNFPPLTEEQKIIIEEIVKIQMKMVEDFAVEHPRVATNARSLHTSDDNMFNTSYETYLRGEISTYSDKMLQLYTAYVIDYARRGGNIAEDTITNTANLYGYDNLASFENNAVTGDFD